jgi:hypothetical protein
LQLILTWSQLRRLLTFLDRLRWRRTLGTLKGLYSGSVWKLSGNVLEERYRLLSRQAESTTNLKNLLKAPDCLKSIDGEKQEKVVHCLEECEESSRNFEESPKSSDIARLMEYQEMLSATAACIICEILEPAWNSETLSMLQVAAPDSSDAKENKSDADSRKLPLHVLAAEEFCVLPYLGFIQNTLGRIRTMAFGIAAMFVAATIGISCYPFDPLPVIGAVFLILFVLVGGTMVFVYAQMCRDATLSHIADTKPGELGWEFWARLAAWGVAPLIALLTTLFPSMTDFVVSFLQPGAQAIK